MSEELKVLDDVNKLQLFQQALQDFILTSSPLTLCGMCSDQEFCPLLLQNKQRSCSYPSNLVFSKIEWWIYANKVALKYKV